MNGLETRLKRYTSKSRKKHWHIDYFIEKARLIAILIIPSEFRLEEKVASLLEEKFEPVIKGFGASDTKSYTHLFYLGDLQISYL